MGKYNQFNRTDYGSGFHPSLQVKKSTSNPLQTDHELQIKQQNSQPNRKSGLQ